MAEQKGEPCSLTLGGYDQSRLIPHNTTFGLNPIQQPEAFLNSITVSASGKESNWSSNSLQMLAPADGIYTIIDSSTPFLWLPKSVCDQFAKALGLTYNDTLELYTFDGNSSRHDDLRTWNLTFTFSLSDTSNPSAIVNITLPYAAFDLQLTYPYIPNTTYSDPDATKNYFPLRRATNENQYTLGRSFLQEAYIITDYERNNFSIHQAIHTTNPIGNTSIINIVPLSESNLAGTPASNREGLSTTAIISIAVSGGVFVILLSLALFFFCRRRPTSPPTHESEKSTTTRTNNRQSRMSFFKQLSGIHEVSGSQMITEMDHESTQRFELADSQVPIELHSESSTHVGREESISPLSVMAYERARRKNEYLANERAKNARDVSEMGHYRTQEIEGPFPSPASWATGTGSTLTNNSSPVSSPLPTYSPGLYSHSSPSSRCVGTLPESSHIPKLIGPDGDTLRIEGDTMDSLGSGFTEQEGMRTSISEMLDLWGGRRDGRTEIVAPRERADMEIVHVPVMAEYRFSWEGPGGENETIMKGETAKYI
jgi:hypothetical protein